MRTEGHGPAAAADALREQLRHVYWIGGGSGAGKSTIARRVAAEHGLQVYDTDELMGDHAKRSTPEDCPLLLRFMAMDMDQRWVNRSPQEMLDTFHWFRGEGFGMISEDILRMPAHTGVVSDGFRLLPHLVTPLLSVTSHAVWFLPTPEFRRSVFDSRGGAQSGFIAKTDDPQRALRNLLECDAMFTERLRDETERLGMNTIEVNSSMIVEELAGRVEEMFGL
jgi:Shikimate kinase